MVIWLLPFLSLVAGEWWQESKAPLLDTTSFSESVGKEKYVLIEFFTPWCHYCHLMFPEFEQFYRLFQDKESSEYRSDLLIARVNAGEYQDLAMRYGVGAFPTILMFEPGNLNYKRRAEGYMRRFELTNHLMAFLPEGPKPAEKPVIIDIRTSPPKSEPPLEPDPHPEPEEAEAVDDPDPEVEYEIVYRDSAGAIKDELNTTYHRLVSALSDHSDSLELILGSVLELLKDIKGVQREERLKDIERFERLDAKIEDLHLDIKQRNRLESAQTRLNFSHMVLFLAIGTLLGAALSLLVAKVRDPGKGHNRV